MRGTAAYVIKRVQNALAAENFVIQERATGSMTFSVQGHRARSSAGPNSSWTYRNRWRMEEFTGNSCGHALPNGSAPIMAALSPIVLREPP